MRKHFLNLNVVYKTHREKVIHLNGNYCSTMENESQNKLKVQQQQQQQQQQEQQQHQQQQQQPTSMNDELRQISGAFVAVSAVPKQKVAEVTEFVDGEIRGHRCLFAFFAHDADTHISRLGIEQLID